MPLAVFGSSLESYKPLEAVAGHQDALMISTSGSVVIKSCLPVEIAFYHDVAPLLDPHLVGRWTAQSYGTLRLEGQVKAGQSTSTEIDPLALRAEAGTISRALDLDVAPREQAKNALVLENIAYPFSRPNIVDIKLGTQLYDEDATPEKKARMERTSATTTSGSMALRITGFRIWNNLRNEFEVTPKQYGKTLKPKELSEGFRRIFPSAVAESDDAGLPAALLKDVLSLIYGRFCLLRREVTSYEWRVRGGSVLIVYEGDAERLQQSLERERLENERYDQDMEDDEESDDEDDDDDNENGPQKTKSFDLRLIDFAHARHYPGQGPDEGFNLGLENLERLLKARLDEL